MQRYSRESVTDTDKVIFELIILYNGLDSYPKQVINGFISLFYRVVMLISERYKGIITSYRRLLMAFTNYFNTRLAYYREFTFIILIFQSTDVVQSSLTYT